jgi:membrane protein implicated in regulation of membrane protease activity
MLMWQLFGIIGIAFLILEMFTPSMFFLNFALASFICVPIAIYVHNVFTLVLIFSVLSFVSFIFLRPILIKKFNKSQETGINSKYIDKVVKTDSEITDSNGVINIYGERWEARSDDGSVIPAGVNVRIVRNESIIMYVKKIDD